MKKLLLLISLALITGIAFSQSPLAVRKSQLNLGVGISGWGVPFYLGFDYGVHKDITLGGELSYRAYNEKWNNDSYHHSIIGFSANANYHFNSVLQIPRQWDLYAGLNLGFYVWNSPDLYDGDHSSNIGIGGQLGGRYYFNDRVGINLEFGGGNAFAGGKFGLTFKL